MIRITTSDKVSVRLTYTKVTISINTIISNVSGEPMWMPSNITNNSVNGYGNFSIGQPYANFVAGSDSYHMPPFSTYSVMGNTISNMSQPSIDWMAEMFDIGSLTRRDTSSSSPRGRNNGRRNRGRGRGQSSDSPSE
jgi:hypothetical protein